MAPSPSATPLTLPPPSPLPPLTSDSVPSLSAQINAATRQQHTVLNRLIIDRLPLALPPRAKTPASFGRGLAVFGHIFFAFEAAWEEVERRAAKDDQPVDEVLCWLAELRPVGLARSDRIRKDLAHIDAITGSNFLSESSCQRSSRQYATQVQDAVRVEPHVLIAYAWLFYMAIFSGGRWIREQLLHAGPAFWEGNDSGPDHPSPCNDAREMSGYSLFFFDSIEDGEDIKRNFKERLAKGESLLTLQEKDAVIKTSRELFDTCITLVGLLDKQMERQKRTSAAFRSLVVLGIGALAVLGFYYL